MKEALKKFKEDFLDVKSKGFVESHRKHNTGIGKTFEDLVGVEENNINSDMTNLVEEYYKKIKFLMISSGYSLETNQGSSSIFKTNRRGIVARGIYSGDSFEVLEGSEVDILNQSKLEKYNQMREELIKDEILIKEGDKYILKKSLEFKTPSGASDFVLGGATNGWTEWKNNENKTLDEVYRKINN